ncbi:MAG: aminoglycoside phosphotransferase family protein [Bacteroidales bacterium]|nr:aminoglycoside phosphotransferase family protein [Bacteroidales bacterium]
MMLNVILKYFPHNKVLSALPFGNGHINDTYKLILEGVSDIFILQRINTKVFPNPKGIVDTHLRLQSRILSQRDTITIAEIIPNTDGEYLTFDDEGYAWRMTSYIEDSYSVDVIEHEWEAYEAGNAYGWFANICSTLKVNEFEEAIRDFHRLSFRLRQLKEAISGNLSKRAGSVKDLIDFYQEREAKLSLIETLTNEGKIPLRVVHNDTKINNLLFRDKKAVAVIDLDTVGPGILYYDYGDALRTSACTAKEDEKNLDLVRFNIEAFKAFSNGYLPQVKSILSNEEREWFYLAPVLLTYIMGIRFLTDYLNGDKYYKISYPGHNLDRSRVQMTLIRSMEGFETDMKSIIDILL